MRSIIMAAALFVLAGCESALEAEQRRRERKSLQDEKAGLLISEYNLQKSLDQATGGKTTLTAEERARAGPIGAELRNVQGRIGSIDARIYQIDHE